MGEAISTAVVPGRTSVVVPTRNSAGTLDRCLVSVREQTYADVELIVVDNGSTDATPEIASRHADRFLDAGPERSAQRNRGAEHATGEYIFMVDSDMMLTPRVVESCVETVRREGAAAVIVPERSVGSGFWAACKALERSCYVGDDLIEAPRFFVRNAFERYGGYDEGLTAGEDWDLPARMRGREPFARIGDEIVHVEGALKLSDTLRKKYYYGRHLRHYVRRHPNLARRQLTLVRPAFIRHRRRLARTPVLTLGMVAMKIAEYAAGALGIVASIVPRRDARPDDR